MRTPEAKFKHGKVIPFLKKLHNCIFYVKEAVSRRGVPDIIGTINGRFFALEVKKSEAETHRNTGRTVLQKYNIERLNASGNFAEFIYPENFEEITSRLRQF